MRQGREEGQGAASDRAYRYALRVERADCRGKMAGGCRVIHMIGHRGVQAWCSGETSLHCCRDPTCANRYFAAPMPHFYCSWLLLPFARQQSTAMAGSLAVISFTSAVNLSLLLLLLLLYKVRLL